MAYLAKIDPQNAAPIVLTGVPANDVDIVDDANFSKLEWSIIRLAKVDGLSTLRDPGPIRRFFNWLMGREGRPSLANERLEALRRVAVLTWHYGFTIPSEDVASFLSAGFSPDQYELMVHRIRAAISSPAQRITA